MNVLRSSADDEFDQRIADSGDIVSIVELARRELGDNALSTKNVAQMVGIGNVVVAVRRGALGEEIIGFIVSSKISDEVVALNTIVIKEKYRGRGFGNVMIKSLLVSVQGFGYQRLQSIVSVDYGEAIHKLLADNDFSVEKKINNIYGGAGEAFSSALLYVKHLSDQ